MPKATVIAPVTIYGTPAKAGEAVEVDAQTFANLVRKGKLAEYVEKAKEDKPTKSTKDK